MKLAILSLGGDSLGMNRAICLLLDCAQQEVTVRRNITPATKLVCFYSSRSHEGFEGATLRGNDKGIGCVAVEQGLDYD